MELRDYLRLLQRRWVTIVAVLAACLVGATAVTVLTPPTYRSTTQVLVAVPAGGVDASSLAAVSATNLSSLVGTFATFAATPPAVAAVTEAAGLTSPGAVSISASVVPTSAILTVSVQATTPAAAQAAASVFIDVFPRVLVDLNQLSSPDALQFSTLVPAGLPSSPSSPDPVINTAIGIVVGLVLGLAVAVAREALDRKIRDSRSIEDRVGVAVLGVVPHELPRESLPAATHPDSARTESYRKIRTALLFSGPDGMARSLAVTSALAGEGKTSLATNLAVVCARAGQRVAVVDADLRQPTVHQKLSLPNEVGLADVLAGELSIHDVAQQDTNGVVVVTSGDRPRDPSAMLESPRFRETIEELEKAFDVVIVDTTPALAVSDASQVSSVCQAVVVVSRLKRTNYDTLKRACTVLERVKRPPLGIVAVGHDEDPDAGYHYYYSAAPAAASEAAARNDDAGADTTGAASWRRRGKHA